ALSQANLHPDDGNLQLSAAGLLLKAGLVDQAIVCQTRAAHAQPARLDLLNGLALMLEQARQVEEAYVLLAELCAAEPRNIEAMFYFGKHLMRRERYSEVVPILSQAVEIIEQGAPESVSNKVSSGVFKTLAEAYFAQGDGIAATQIARQGLKLGI